MTDQPWTIQRLLDWTTQFFKDKGMEGARLDAEVLLSNCLQCQRIQLYTRFGEQVTDEMRADFRDKVKRHAAGEPVAYLVGHREFYSLDFKVTKDVLIPRPETEHLVIEALDRFEDRREAELQICEVGTGSGIISVCLAKYLPNAKITAVDISPAALEIAKENAEKHQVADRIQFCNGDLLAKLPADGKFDAIVSNPPYVSPAELKEVDASVRDFEPEVALLGAGDDGGDTSRTLMQQAKERLQPGGYLLFETSPMLAQKLLAFAKEEASYPQAGIIKDSAGLDRIVWMQLG